MRQPKGEESLSQGASSGGSGQEAGARARASAEPGPLRRGTAEAQRPRRAGARAWASGRLPDVVLSLVHGAGQQVAGDGPPPPPPADLGPLAELAA
jgi:hypothetical protein